MKDEVRVESGSAWSSTAPEASRKRAVGRFGEVRTGQMMLHAAAWSFDGVVRRVLAFARAAELENEKSIAGELVAASSENGFARAKPGSPAFDALRLFVRSLDAETQGKLRAVMRAGREAEPLQLAAAAIATEDAAVEDGGPEVFAGGTAALQDLQRGHAVACATTFDLELPLAGWSAVGRRESLDERVWLRFGRELARSRVEEWSCFAVVDSRDHLRRLYLRRGKHRWWSFDAVIDRPSDGDLGLARSARACRSRIVTLSLQSALGRSCHPNQRAVRRASFALSARLGMCRVSQRRSRVTREREA